MGEEEGGRETFEADEGAALVGCWRRSVLLGTTASSGHLSHILSLSHLLGKRHEPDLAEICASLQLQVLHGMSLTENS